MRAILIIGIALLSYSVFGQQPYIANKTVSLMGSSFSFTAIHENDTIAWKSIESAIQECQRIERLISSWNPESQTSEVNKNAGERPVKVSGELFQLIERAKKVSDLTNGAFDISFASIDKLWKFDGSMTTLPSEKEINASVRLIDYQSIILNKEDTTVLLARQGMKIGFGGIGKGYAANKAKQIMQEQGIANGIVNAGGDLITWGTQADGESWKVGIAAPDAPGQIVSWVTVSGQAVVTSGDYERYAEIGGNRYAHIIDPRTGWPVTGVRSVTVICPDAELADALATAVFVMGPKKGIELIDQLASIECLIVDDSGNFLSSKNLKLNYYRNDQREENFPLKIGSKK